MGLCASSPKDASAPAGAKGSDGSSHHMTAEEKVQSTLQGKRLAIQRHRRINITAESYDVEGRGGGVQHYEKKKIPKPAGSRDAILHSLRSHFLFTTLADREIEEVADAMEEVTLKAGDIIIKQGDEGDRFYVSETGEFDVFVNGAKVGTIPAGGNFGELALMYNCPRAATIKATKPSRLWALGRVAFRHILVANTHKTIADNMRFLAKVPILKSLTQEERARLAEALQRVTFEDAEYIIRQGEEGNVFYLLSEGKCRVTKNGEGGTEETVLHLKEGDHFGERALINSEPRAANVIAQGPVVCMALDRESFTELLGPLEEIMKMEHGRRVEMEKRNRARAVAKVTGARAGAGGEAKEGETRQLRGDVQLKDLRPVAILGEGAFGLVKLVEHKGSREVFALKQMQKARIVATSQQRNVVNEKRIMMECDHPYILKLVATFKDPNCVYMLLEFLQGGDMFGHLVRHDGVFNEATSKHYGAIVSTVFDYLHSKSVVYRDLKPENLVLDRHGFLKVVDFGFAKKITTRTYTLCGTPEYLAPEIVQGKGHNKAVDWWALGILIYEMLCGFSPFADQENNDQLTIYKNILRGKIVFPSSLRSASAKDLIKKLLHPNASQRLGCLKDAAADVMNHKWFSDMDWHALLQQKIKPPIRPQVSSSLDTSNFDDWGPDPQRIEPYVPDGTNWDAEF